VRRLVLTDFMSLDGVVQAPGGADEDTEGDDPFATFVNEVTRYVVSTTLTGPDLTWTNSELLGGGKMALPADGERRPLELVSVETTPTCVLPCVHRPGETPPMPDGD
jgi:hypothetical protein